MTKQSILLSFLIIGTAVGAGFSSGKEVAIYFASFGVWGLLISIFCFVAFSLIFYYCLKLGYKLRNSQNIFADLTGKYEQLFKKAIWFFSVILISGMLAGSYSLSRFIFNPEFCFIVPFILFIIIYFVTISGLKGTSITNLILIPFALIIIAIICILSLKNSGTSTLLKPSFNLIFIIPSTINYIFANVFLIGVLLIQIGKNYTNKEIKFASVSSSFIISIFIFSITLTIICFNNSTYISDMPIMILAQNVGEIFSYIMLAVIGICLFTTALSSSLIVYNNKQNKKNLIITLVISYLISFVGFEFFIKYFYQIEGIISFALYFLIYLSNLKLQNKKIK